MYFRRRNPHRRGSLGQKRRMVNLIYLLPPSWNARKPLLWYQVVTVVVRCQKPICPTVLLEPKLRQSDHSGAIVRRCASGSADRPVKAELVNQRVTNQAHKTSSHPLHAECLNHRLRRERLDYCNAHGMKRDSTTSFRQPCSA